IETATLELSNGTRFALGPFTVTNLNVDYLLSLQGIGTPTGDSTDLESVWSSLSLGPTQIASEDGTCALEGIEAGALLMRQPSRISLAGLFDYIDEARDAAKAAEDVEDETERRALRAEAAEK